MKRLNLEMEESLYMKFKLACVNLSVSMSERVRDLIVRDLEMIQELKRSKESFKNAMSPPAGYKEETVKSNTEPLTIKDIEKPLRIIKIKPGCIGNIAHESGTCGCYK